MNVIPLNLVNLDLSHEFDLSIILNYYSCNDLKLKSTMGFHYNNTYNLSEKYLNYSNSRVENTLTVIDFFLSCKGITLGKVTFDLQKYHELLKELYLNMRMNI